MIRLLETFRPSKKNIEMQYQVNEVSQIPQAINVGISRPCAISDRTDQNLSTSYFVFELLRLGVLVYQRW